MSISIDVIFLSIVLTYDELWGEWRFQRICDLMRILADAPFRVLIVWKASLKLFCLPCLFEGPDIEWFAYPTLASLRGCHLSEGTA